jgi:hypothetical protein
MSGLQAVIFDFDGVILESVDVKGWAFGRLFEGFPEHTEKILYYHHAHGGVSRHVKFRYIYENILKQTLSDEKFGELCEQYSQLVFDKVVGRNIAKESRYLLFREHPRRKCEGLFMRKIWTAILKEFTGLRAQRVIGRRILCVITISTRTASFLLEMQ